MEKITMAELAKKAGVSTATLRKFLKHERVRNDLAEKIEMAIRETGYILEEHKEKEVIENGFEESKSIQEDFAGKSQQHCLAFVAKEITQLNTQTLFLACERLIAASQYLLLACETKGDAEREKAYLSMLANAQVKGVILESCLAADEVTAILGNIPYVSLQQGTNTGIGCVNTLQGGELLGEYLLQKHHMIIRYLGMEEAGTIAYCEGIKDSYHKRKQPLDFTVKLCDGSLMDMYAKLKEILSEKIDVLILECDEMMIPLQRYLKEYHISVPQNMSVISIGGHAITKMASPKLTTLRFDYDAYATSIMKKLLQTSFEKENEAKSFFCIEEGESVR